MLTRLVREIHEEAERARTSPAPELTFSLWRRFADGGDRLAYEGAYFERRRRLAALLLAAHLDDRPDPALDDLLWSVCDEYSWVLPAHEPKGGDPNAFVDLFAAETAQTLAEGVRLLGGHVDARVRARVRAEVERRVFAPLEAGTMWWESARHNWSAVCAGAAGAAALALGADRVVARLEGAMEAFLSGTGADGACLEGPDYWAYGFGYFVYFAEALREHTGEDLLDDPHVREMAAYPARVDLGDGTRPAFADAQARGVYPAGLLSRLSERLGVPVPVTAGEPSFHDDPCYRWAHLSRTLWWAREVPVAEPGPHTYLPDAGIVVARSGGAAFAAKGGHNDEPHNHNDLGHFLLAAGGEVLLTDLGAGEYRKGYFDDDTRYTFLHNSSEGHSVPVIASRGQSAGRRRAARVLRCEPGPDGVDYELDLTAAYEADGLRSLRRRFSWRRTPGELLLTDEVRAEHELTVDEVFVSRIEPRWEGSHAVWEGKTARARLAVPRQCVARDVETLHTTDHDGAPDTVHRLRVRFTVPAGTTSLRFTCTLQGR